MQEDNHVYLCNMLFLNHHLNKMVNKPLDKIDFVASPWLQSSIIATFYNKVPYYFIKKNIKTSYVIFPISTSFPQSTRPQNRTPPQPSNP